jgi:hypothetical protein
MRVILWSHQRNHKKGKNSSWVKWGFGQIGQGLVRPQIPGKRQIRGLIHCA